MSTVKKPAIKRRAAAETRQAPDMRAAFTTRPGGEVKNTSIDLPVELHERLRVRAFTEHTTMKQLIIDALEAAYPAQ